MGLSRTALCNRAECVTIDRAYVEDVERLRGPGLRVIFDVVEECYFPCLWPRLHAESDDDTDRSAWVSSQYRTRSSSRECLFNPDDRKAY